MNIKITKQDYIGSERADMSEKSREVTDKILVRFGWTIDCNKNSWSRTIKLKSQSFK